MNFHIKEIPISNRTRAFIGFGIGFMIMLAVVQIFHINNFDFENMQRGVRLILSGVNPWATQTRISHFYNPPHAALFLWPMLFTTPKLYLAFGGALLVALIFYHRAWVGLAWFATNTFLWIIAAGGIDMFVIGAGLLLLIFGDKSRSRWLALLWRVLAYGILMIKPQGGLFIVVLYILTRRDWRGFLLSIFVYGLLFLPLIPDWLSVLRNDPPLAQTVATHTFYAKFGFGFASLIAFMVLISRKWRYWELGGALAGILMPYGMPGLPIFLTLTAVQPLKAIPVVIIYSALLAMLTWRNLPAGLDNPEYVSHLMAIYHLGMLGISLILACITDKTGDEPGIIAVGDRIKSRLSLFSNLL